MMIHFPSRKNRDKPGVLLFPKILICLDCGFSQFAAPKRNWHCLEQIRRQVNPLHGGSSVESGATHKPLSRNDCFYSSEQLGSGPCFHNVAPRAYAQSFLHHFARRFLAQEDYSGRRDKFANLSSDLEAIQDWESDVQQNQIWLQFHRFLNRCQSVRHFTNDL